VTVTATKTYDGTQFTATYMLTVTSPCLDPETFTASTQLVQPTNSDYSPDAEVVFVLTPFDVTPPLCSVTYAVLGVTRQDDGRRML
jgi:hypothetical protein